MRGARLSPRSLADAVLTGWALFVLLAAISGVPGNLAGFAASSSHQRLLTENVLTLHLCLATLSLLLLWKRRWVLGVLLPAGTESGCDGPSCGIRAAFACAGVTFFLYTMAHAPGDIWFPYWLPHDMEPRALRIGYYLTPPVVAVLALLCLFLWGRRACHDGRTEASSGGRVLVGIACRVVAAFALVWYGASLVDDAVSHLDSAVRDTPLLAVEADVFFLVVAVLLVRQWRWVSKRLCSSRWPKAHAPSEWLTSTSFERFAMAMVAGVAILRVVGSWGQCVAVNVVVPRWNAAPDWSPGATMYATTIAYLVLASLILVGPGRLLLLLRGLPRPPHDRDASPLRPRALEGALLFGLGAWFVVHGLWLGVAFLGPAPNPYHSMTWAAHVAVDVGGGALLLALGPRRHSALGTPLGTAARATGTVLLLGAVPSIVELARNIIGGVAPPWSLGPSAVLAGRTGAGLASLLLLLGSALLLLVVPALWTLVHASAEETRTS